MKYIILSLLLSVISGCSMKPVDTSALKYEKILTFSIGVSNESDVVKALGSPALRTEKNGYYTLSYNDPKTDFQRLSLNFLSESQKLSGFVWVPFHGEKEASVTAAKAGFRGATFKTVVQDGDNPHAISATTSLVDEKSGISILLGAGQNTVEAIAMYDVNNRLPANEVKKTQAPYTFGDQ